MLRIEPLCLETEGPNCCYFYDRIRINTELYLDELRARFSEYSQDFQDSSLKPAYLAAQAAGFKSRLELSNPSMELLHSINNDLSGVRVSVSYVEITRDIFCETKSEAYFKTNKIFETLRKKYSPWPFIFDQKLNKKRRRRPRDPALFSDRTGYYGMKKFKYVLYARLSKINNMPCLHSEWRITGATTIRRKTGIKSIQDLSTLEKEKFFEKTAEAYLFNGEINTDKLGMWINGWSKKKRFTERQRISIDIAAATLMQAYGVKTFDDLVDFFIDQKTVIKSYTGRRIQWHKKVLALNEYGKFLALA